MGEQNPRKRRISALSPGNAMSLYVPLRKGTLNRAPPNLFVLIAEGYASFNACPVIDRGPLQSGEVPVADMLSINGC